MFVYLSLYVFFFFIFSLYLNLDLNLIWNLLICYFFSIPRSTIISLDKNALNKTIQMSGNERFKKKKTF